MSSLSGVINTYWEPNNSAPSQHVVVKTMTATSDHCIASLTVQVGRKLSLRMIGCTHPNLVFILGYDGRLSMEISSD